MGRILCVIFFGLTLAGSVQGIEERALTTAEIERYNKVTHALIAPCCWREPIAIHRSAQALQMLEEIKQLVADGRSEEEVKAIYVERYGVRILADPPGRDGQWLYIVPVALLCCWVVLAVLRLRLLVAGVAPPAPHAPAELIARVRMETESEWS
jgi:cytochrome c-type biogenesis protein CcmH